VLERTPGAIESVSKRLPSGFPAKVADTIFRGLQQSAQKLERMPKA